MLPELEGKLRLEPHPARIYVHGIPVIAFPEERQILLERVRLGYCHSKPGHPILFINSYPKEFANAVREWVEGEIRRTNGLAADAKVVNRMSMPVSDAAMERYEEQVKTEENEEADEDED
jgi:hypothetical protein